MVAYTQMVHTPQKNKGLQQRAEISRVYLFFHNAEIILVHVIFFCHSFTLHPRAMPQYKLILHYILLYIVLTVLSKLYISIAVLLKYKQ